METNAAGESIALALTRQLMDCAGLLAFDDEAIYKLPFDFDIHTITSHGLGFVHGTNLPFGDTNHFPTPDSLRGMMPLPQITGLGFIISYGDLFLNEDEKANTACHIRQQTAHSIALFQARGRSRIHYTA